MWFFWRYLEYIPIASVIDLTMKLVAVASLALGVGATSAFGGPPGIPMDAPVGSPLAVNLIAAPVGDGAPPAQLNVRLIASGARAATSNTTLNSSWTKRNNSQQLKKRPLLLGKKR